MATRGMRGMKTGGTATATTGRMKKAPARSGRGGAGKKVVKKTLYSGNLSKGAKAKTNVRK